MYRTVMETPELKACLKNGSSVISSTNKGKFTFNSSVKGSIDLDKCFKTSYPSENRWDYLIMTASQTEGYFVEIHPASTGEVDKIIKKKEWLKNRIIANYFSSIRNQKYKIVWLATGSVHITRGSSQARKCAQAGLNPVKHLTI